MAEQAGSFPRRYFGRLRGLSSNVLALSAVSLLNDTSSEIIYPLLPTFLALTLGASPFAIGLIEGIAESVASLLKLFSGYVSDKIGNRKLPVFVGYALAAVTRPFLSFVTTWYFGLPTSSSHALVGAYAGSAIACFATHFGFINIQTVLIAEGWLKTLAFIVLSPLIGM